MLAMFTLVAFVGLVPACSTVTDLTCLENNLHAQESHLDHLEMWLAFATAAVVLGLILEYRGDIEHHVKALRNKELDWASLLTFLGAILVTLGVAAELLVQVLASRTESRIKNENHSVERLLDAKTQAALTEQEKLRNDNLTLQHNNLIMQQLIQPRSLSPDQERRIAADLSRFIGQRVLLTFDPSDDETYELSEQLLATLAAAKLNAKPLDMGGNPLMVGPRLIPGIKITWFQGQRAVAVAIKEALESIGKLRDVYLEEGQGNDPALIISVRPKPRPKIPMK
jgi:hypothetical protein